MTTIEGLIKEACFPEEKQNDQGNLEKIAKALNSASSIPYRADTYEAACGIMKIASQAFDGLLKKASELEKMSEVREVIDDMLDRGMISREDVQTKTAALIKKNGHELEVFKEAIKLASAKSNSLFESDQPEISNVRKSMFEEVL
jgi:hypothetical protein